MATVTKTLARAGVTVVAGDSQIAGSFGIYQDPVCDVYAVQIVLDAADLIPYARRTSPYALTYPPYDRIAGNRQDLGGGNLDSPPLLDFELDVTCGKSLWYSTTDSGALVYQASPTDEVYLNVSADTGDCVGINYVPNGTATNSFGNLAPKFDCYVFYVNLIRLSGFARIGILESSVLSDAWGRPCCGSHLRAGETWGLGNSYLYPAYAISASPTSELGHNFRITPSANRPLTFTESGHITGPSWTFLKTYNGAYVDQTVQTPLGTHRSDNNNAYSFTSFLLRKTWLIPGATHQIYTVGLQNYGDEVFKIHYFNICGKELNPGGTVLGLTRYGPASGGDYFFHGSFTAPAKAVRYALYATTPSDPGRDPYPPPLYNHNTINPHYASEYGDFVPGLYNKASVTTGDFP